MKLFKILKNYFFYEHFCPNCNSNKLKANLLFFNLLLFFYKKLNTSTFFLLNNIKSLNWYTCKNCKIFVNPSFLGKQNSKFIKSSPYSRTYTSEDIKFRENLYLNKYKGIRKFVLEHNIKSFCEVSSDFGFLLNKLHEDGVKCLGIEPELHDINIKKNFIFFNKTFEESVEDINNFKPEVISFSCCFRSIDPNYLSLITSNSVKYLIINEANDLINHYTNGYNLFKLNDYFYRFKAFSYSSHDIVNILGQRNFKIHQIKCDYFNPNEKMQFLTSFYFVRS